MTLDYSPTTGFTQRNPVHLTTYFVSLHSAWPECDTSGGAGSVLEPKARLFQLDKREQTSLSSGSDQSERPAQVTEAVK
jgi:hypothetical protein